MKISKGGFTLIELLVVVAIIGLLASIVLASLNSARSKSGDAAVKSNLANIRAQSALIYSNSGCYGDGTPITDTTCAPFTLGPCLNTTDNSIFKNPIVWAQISAAKSAAGGFASCMSTGSAWSVGIQMKEKPDAEAWCVDSNGTSKKESFVSSPPQSQGSLDMLITDLSGAAKCD
ncbi:MAG TPA: type II secretion system protein [Candidatus Paceibacterota bacterium]|nr:type II secretion system protein [Candidatus Paceibacterota bacterium]